MTWRLAKSLETLRSQVNARWPSRSKNSDGALGDEHHSARTSDHNPNEHGVVCAIDITHDPKGGFDSYAFADMILHNQDGRLKYVISNRRIGSGPAADHPGIWRPYRGVNPHDHHCHISVVSDGHGDDTAAWDIAGYHVGPAIEPYVPPPLTVTIGASGPDVERVQRLLGCAITGKFAPRSETEFALRLFQVRHGLEPDARCGPMTWAMLEPRGT